MRSGFRGSSPPPPAAASSAWASSSAAWTIRGGGASRDGEGTMSEGSEFVLGVAMFCRPSDSTRRRRLSRPRILLGVLGLLAALAAPAAAQPTAPSKDLIARGKYVFGVAAGCGCHTEPDKAATALNAGGRKYEGPFGTVYATNITPDAETGI